MSSSSGLLLLAAALAAQTHPESYLQASACPARQASQPLTTVDVFDGPPSERADLVPDIATGSRSHTISSWNVASIYRAGRHVFLVCTYAAAAPALIIEVSPTVDRCIFRRHPHRPAQLTCH